MPCLVYYTCYSILFLTIFLLKKHCYFQGIVPVCFWGSIQKSVLKIELVFEPVHHGEPTEKSDTVNKFLMRQYNQYLIYHHSIFTNFFHFNGYSFPTPRIGILNNLSQSDSQEFFQYNKFWFTFVLFS